jgi:3-oxoacyl-[acyl-carrier protein] reductase
MANALSGRAALITGAGGEIGSAISLALAAEGAAVALGEVNLAAAERVAAEIRSRGGRAVALAMDVAAAGSVTAAVRAAVAELGGLDILVNNAGLCPLNRFEDIPLDEWNRVLAVNLTGAFLCSQAALPHLKQSKHGRIINIASIAGRTGGIAVGAHYSASKAGLIGLNKVLARTLAPFGVTANCVAPGTMEAGMTASWAQDVRENLRRSVPLGRLGQASDVAAAVVYLASDAAAWVTGATLDVNGGTVMA